jgi:hypothetical protein
MTAPPPQPYSDGIRMPLDPWSKHDEKQADYAENEYACIFHTKFKSRENCKFANFLNHLCVIWSVGGIFFFQVKWINARV